MLPKKIDLFKSFYLNYYNFFVARGKGTATAVENEGVRLKSRSNESFFYEIGSKRTRVRARVCAY